MGLEGDRNKEKGDLGAPKEERIHQTSASVLLKCVYSWVTHPKTREKDRQRKNETGRAKAIIVSSIT
jgi:hypothetical protein